ncbi:hypothetical protein HDU81_003623 [Chytriomyces hyalinus]|nr:hypothetical protein HDU81_003623 [Chytriomyces hyalinus]
MAWRALDKYKITKQLGDGTFGSVLLGVNVVTGEKVAIKKMKKLEHLDDSIRLREVKALSKLGKHKNIIKLKEMIRDRRTDELNLVYEYMDGDLFQKMRDLEARGEFFSQTEIKSYILQLLQGLDHMHKRGLFHRDMKPENLLLTNDVLKIADFGLAKEFNCEPPFSDYVTTRWYRAPEVLLKSPTYSTAIDIWGAATIFAEVLTLQALFPGDSELDEIFKICAILGSPKRRIDSPDSSGDSQEDDIENDDPSNPQIPRDYYSRQLQPVREEIVGGGEWEEGFLLAEAMGSFAFPEMDPVPLETVFPDASTEALQMIADMLRYNPVKRPTAGQLVMHPWFDDVRKIRAPARKVKEKRKKGALPLFKKSETNQDPISFDDACENEARPVRKNPASIARQERSVSRGRTEGLSSGFEADELPQLPAKISEPVVDYRILDRKISEIDIEVEVASGPRLKSDRSHSNTRRDVSDSEKMVKSFEKKKKQLESMLGHLSLAEEDEKEHGGALAQKPKQFSRKKTAKDKLDRDNRMAGSGVSMDAGSVSSLRAIEGVGLMFYQKEKQEIKQSMMQFMRNIDSEDTITESFLNSTQSDQEDPQLPTDWKKDSVGSGIRLKNRIKQLVHLYNDYFMKLEGMVQEQNEKAIKTRLTPMSTRKKQTAKWTVLADAQLRAAAAANENKWALVAAALPGRSAAECQTRFEMINSANTVESEPQSDSKKSTRVTALRRSPRKAASIPMYTTSNIQCQNTDMHPDSGVQMFSEFDEYLSKALPSESDVPLFVQPSPNVRTIVNRKITTNKVKQSPAEKNSKGAVAAGSLSYPCTNAGCNKVYAVRQSYHYHKKNCPYGADYSSPNVKTTTSERKSQKVLVPHSGNTNRPPAAGISRLQNYSADVYTSSSPDLNFLMDGGDLFGDNPLLLDSSGHGGFSTAGALNAAWSSTDQIDFGFNLDLDLPPPPGSFLHQMTSNEFLNPPLNAAPAAPLQGSSFPSSNGPSLNIQPVIQPKSASQAALEIALKSDALNENPQSSTGISRSELEMLFEEFSSQATVDEIESIIPKSAEPNWMWSPDKIFSAEQLTLLKMQMNHNFQLVSQAYVIEKELHGPDAFETQHWEDQLRSLESARNWGIKSAGPTSFHNSLPISRFDQVAALPGPSRNVPRTEASKIFVKCMSYQYTEHENKGRSNRIREDASKTAKSKGAEARWAGNYSTLPAVAPLFEGLIKLGEMCRGTWSQTLVPNILRTRKKKVVDFVPHEEALLLRGIVCFGVSDIESIRAHCLPAKTMAAISERIKTLTARGKEDNPIKALLLRPFKAMTLVEKDLMRAGILTNGEGFLLRLLKLFPHHPVRVLNAEWSYMHTLREVPVPFPNLGESNCILPEVDVVDRWLTLGNEEDNEEDDDDDDDDDENGVGSEGESDEDEDETGSDSLDAVEENDNQTTDFFKDAVCAEEDDSEDEEYRLDESRAEVRRTRLTDDGEAASGEAGISSAFVKKRKPRATKVEVSDNGNETSWSYTANRREQSLAPSLKEAAGTRLRKMVLSVQSGTTGARSGMAAIGRGRSRGKKKPSSILPPGSSRTSPNAKSSSGSVFKQPLPFSYVNTISASPTKRAPASSHKNNNAKVLPVESDFLLSSEIDWPIDADLDIFGGTNLSNENFNLHETSNAGDDLGFLLGNALPSLGLPNYNKPEVAAPDFNVQGEFDMDQFVKMASTFTGTPRAKTSFMESASTATGNHSELFLPLTSPAAAVSARAQCKINNGGPTASTPPSMSSVDRPKLRSSQPLSRPIELSQEDLESRVKPCGVEKSGGSVTALRRSPRKTRKRENLQDENEFPVFNKRAKMEPLQPLSKTEAPVTRRSRRSDIAIAAALAGKVPLGKASF